MALLKDNPDGTKSGYKRPRSVQQIFSRSIRWETSLHHTTPEGVEVANEEIEPVNASQAAHDRMTLRVYAQKMEKQWWEAKEELARVQKLPELDWARATSEFMQHLASLARSGEQPRAKAAVDTLDKLKVYVDRKIAEAEKYRELQIAKEKTVEGLKEELRIKEQEYDGLQIWVGGAKNKIARLENKLEEGVCHKCRERERIMASLPQDGSRGQKDAWDELLDRISNLEGAFANYLRDDAAEHCRDITESEARGMVNDLVKEHQN